jgi:hypothetical protein
MILQIIKSNNKLVGEKINMMNARERIFHAKSLRLCVKKKPRQNTGALHFHKQKQTSYKQKPIITITKAVQI